MNSVLGVVLAGGLSRRMEGNEKSLLQIDGKPLIHHVSERLEQQVSKLLINANGDPARFNFLGIPVAPDTVEGFAGPLAGVLAAMRWAEANGDISHILTAAADTPFFPTDYAERMVATAQADNAEIALAASNGRRHPVFGLWPVDLADDLEGFLRDQEGRKVMIYVERYRNTIVDFPIGKHDPFFNVNTPADMETAEAMAAELA